MNQLKNDPWPASPWLGEGADVQFALWRAGCDWAAMSNSFFNTTLQSSSVLVSAPVEPQQHDISPPAERAAANSR